MVILILEKVPTSLRGELSRWMLEPHTGVFVGTPPARVRDKLWERATKNQGKGGCLLIHNSNTEQGFAMRVSGSTRRTVANYDGLLLVRLPPSEKANL